MAPPTLAKLAERAGDKSYLDLNDKYFRETYDRLYDKEDRLYARDASFPAEESEERTGRRSSGAAYPGGESSGNGFYTYALMWGINNKLLDRKSFTPVVRRAWTGLNTLIHPDGKVGWTQPIGADPRRNFNADSWEVYGAGAYLLAGSEIVKLQYIDA